VEGSEPGEASVERVSVRGTTALWISSPVEILQDEDPFASRIASSGRARPEEARHATRHRAARREALVEGAFDLVGSSLPRIGHLVRARGRLHPLDDDALDIAPDDLDAEDLAITAPERL
jgi:hypothetical protein